MFQNETRCYDLFIKKNSLKVTTFSQLVVVSSIHKYTNSTERCCIYIGNQLIFKNVLFWLIEIDCLILWNNVFWYDVKLHILLMFLQYTICWEKTQIKIFPTHNKCYKKYTLFSSCELQLITVLLLMCDSYILS